MQDPRCDVEVGIHPGPFWIGQEGKLKVCNRHKAQYEERADEFGPFDWQPQHRANDVDLAPINTFEPEVNTTCSVSKPSGWGMRTRCGFKAGHTGDHSWVVDL
jgi:hypothetical protein